MAVLTPRTLVRNGSVGLTTGQLTTALATSLAIVQALGTNISAIQPTTAHTDSATNVNTTFSTQSSGFCDVLIDKDDTVGVIVNWCTASTDVTANIVVAPGSMGGAWQSNQGLFYVTMEATDADEVHQRIIGPFESARFGYASTDGSPAIRIYVSASATDMNACQASIQAFKMPTVAYDT